MSIAFNFISHFWFLRMKNWIPNVWMSIFYYPTQKVLSVVNKSQIRPCLAAFSHQTRKYLAFINKKYEEQPVGRKMKKVLSFLVFTMNHYLPIDKEIHLFFINSPFANHGVCILEKCISIKLKRKKLIINMEMSITHSTLCPFHDWVAREIWLSFKRAYEFFYRVHILRHISTFLWSIA